MPADTKIIHSVCNADSRQVRLRMCVDTFKVGEDLVVGGRILVHNSLVQSSRACRDPPWRVFVHPVKEGHAGTSSTMFTTMPADSQSSGISSMQPHALRSSFPSSIGPLVCSAWVAMCPLFERTSRFFVALRPRNSAFVLHTADT
jgi:hypothetical protein